MQTTFRGCADRPRFKTDLLLPDRYVQYVKVIRMRYLPNAPDADGDVQDAAPDDVPDKIFSQLCIGR
jgi:hypothetical protein